MIWFFDFLIEIFIHRSKLSPTTLAVKFGSNYTSTLAHMIDKTASHIS